MTITLYVDCNSFTWFLVSPIMEAEQKNEEEKNRPFPQQVLSKKN